MREPLVSIITPSYNRKNFIELNIQSIMNQTYKNIEHIIIDGASNDGTIDILKKYEGKYNMRWISEIDEGMYHAINKGIKMAKGEIIAYLNTDDLYFPWSVEVAVRELKKRNIGMIYGDALRIDLRFNRNKLLLMPLFNYKIFSCVRGLGIIQPSVFLNKSVFEKIGLFDTSFRVSADSEFWCRIAKNSIPMKKINELLSIEISHDQAFSFNNDDEYIKDVHTLRRLYCPKEVHKFIKIIGFINKIRSSFLARLFLLELVVYYIFFRVVKKKPRKWGLFIESIENLRVIDLLREVLPYRIRFKKFNYLIDFVNDNIINIVLTNITSNPKK